MTLPTNGVFRCAIDLPIHSEFIVCVCTVCNEAHKSVQYETMANPIHALKNRLFYHNRP